MTTAAYLFDGIHGYGLGLETVGVRAAYAVEWADFPHRITGLRRPGIDQLRDVRDVHNPPRAPVMAGGFPCQDLSVAGLGAGITGSRSGLWTEYARLIAETGPDVVLIENVPALLRRGFELVLENLWELGYAAEWDCLPAAAFGAPHLRDRVWIVAHRRTDGPAGVFGQPMALFPHAPDAHRTEGWRRYPRAGYALGPDAIMELEPLAPLAAVRGGAVMPTPIAADASNVARATTNGGTGMAPGSTSHYGETLLDAVRKGRLLPTGDGRAQLREVAFIDQVSSPAALALWPTPKASPSGPDYARAGRDGSGGDDLATAVARTVTGALNPDWVEWLMGFPLGWTDPDVDNDALRFHPWQEGEPADVPRISDRSEYRRDRLTALGNALVPQAPAWIARRLVDSRLIDPAATAAP